MLEFLLVLIIVAIVVGVSFRLYEASRTNVLGQNLAKDLNIFTEALQNYCDTYKYYPQAYCALSSWTSNSTCNTLIHFIGSDYPLTNNYSYSYSSYSMSIILPAENKNSAQNALVAISSNQFIKQNFNCTVTSSGNFYFISCSSNSINCI